MLTITILGYQQLLVTNNDGIKFLKFRLSLLMYGTNISNFVYCRDDLAELRQSHRYLQPYGHIC
jgi:hypothetical protein